MWQLLDQGMGSDALKEGKAFSEGFCPIGKSLSRPVIGGFKRGWERQLYPPLLACPPRTTCMQEDPVTCEAAYHAGSHVSASWPTFACLLPALGYQLPPQPSPRPLARSQQDHSFSQGSNSLLSSRHFGDATGSTTMLSISSSTASTYIPKSGCANLTSTLAKGTNWLEHW